MSLIIIISHHHHLFLNCECRWGTTDNFATNFPYFSLFSTAFWDLPNSRPVHSLTLSSHLFLCLPCLLLPFTVPCKMVLARPDERETWPYHYNLRLFTIVRRFACGPIACWILARSSCGPIACWILARSSCRPMPAGSWHGWNMGTLLWTWERKVHTRAWVPIGGKPASNRPPPPPPSPQKNRSKKKVLYTIFLNSSGFVL